MEGKRDMVGNRGRENRKSLIKKEGVERKRKRG